MIKNTPPYHILIVTGELSGDMHAGRLVAEIKKKIPGIRISATGGPSLKREGVTILADINELSVVGFSEVIKRYNRLKKIFDKILGFIRKERPSLIICVDFPGFNLRLAPHIHKLDIPLIYYISPQIWAWKYGRIKSIKKYVTHMIPLLPFEQDIYRREGVPVSYFGHPLADEIESKMRQLKIAPTKGRKVITFLPGSRKHEIDTLLPDMVILSQMLKNQYPEIEIRFACADTMNPDHIREKFGKETRFDVIKGKTYELIRSSHLVITASGTASLETSLLETPVIVLYKVKWLSYILFKLIVKIRFISLTNIILGKEVIKEFIGPKLNRDSIYSEARKILDSKETVNKMRLQFRKLRKILLAWGSYRKTASFIVSEIKK